MFWRLDTYATNVLKRTPARWAIECGLSAEPDAATRPVRVGDTVVATEPGRMLRLSSYYSPGDIGHVMAIEEDQPDPLVVTWTRGPNLTLRLQHGDVVAITADTLAPPAPSARAEDLPPEILRAIATLVEETWDREQDDYRQQDPDGRVGHPYRAHTALHHWLGEHSPIRGTDRAPR